MRRARAFLRDALDGRSWPAPARGALLAWIAFYAVYFVWIFLRSPRMPLLVSANVFVHEAGHLVFAVLGTTAMFLGGTIAQLAFPVAALVSFGARRHQPGSAFCLFWLGANLVHVGVYMADARAGVLPLLGGGEHDWEYLFSLVGLLEADTVIGGATRGLGWGLMLAAPAWLARTFLATRRETQPGLLGEPLAPPPSREGPRPPPRKSGPRWGSE